jgi:hypothetical protein
VYVQSVERFLQQHVRAGKLSSRVLGSSVLGS